MRFYIGSIQVHIHPIFLLVAGLLAFLNTSTPLGALIFGGIILVSVLIHELGHALSALYFGQRAKIDLYGLGGVTHRKGPDLHKWQEFAIVFFGPLFGFSLAIFARVLLKFSSQMPPLLVETLDIVQAVNIFWTIVNLLPILPLDGGHLMRIFFEKIFGYRGLRISLFISLILAAGIGVLAFVSGIFLAGAIFLMFAFDNFRSFQALSGSTELDRDETLQSLIKKGMLAKEEGDDDEAIAAFNTIREKTKSGLLFQEATEVLSSLVLKKGDPQQALSLLKEIGALSPEGLKNAMEANFQLGQFRDAIEHATKLYQLYPSPEIAFFLARSHARLKSADAAIGWIQRAVNDGLKDPEKALLGHDFDEIRSSAPFQELFNPE